MPTVERRLVVTEEAGLHARPAAAFAQAAARLDAEVTIGRAESGTPPVSARSVLSLLTLNIRCGDEIVLSAHSSDEKAAGQALDTLAALAAPA